LLRYINGPLLAIVYSFSFPAFASDGAKNPTHIFGFANAHFVSSLVLFGLIVPQWFNVLVPVERRDDGNKMYAPNTTIMDGQRESDSLESAEGISSGPTKHEKSAEYQVPELRQRL
jgi:solute carrier family 6 (neurotransmitter transporter, GABA) member 1